MLRDPIKAGLIRSSVTNFYSGANMNTGITRRGALGVFGGSAAAAVLAACGTSGGSSASGGGTLRMGDYEAGPQAALTEKVLAAFKRQANIAVTLDNLPGSGAAIYPGKIRTELLGGKAPDLFRCWGGSIVRPFLTSHQVISLDSTYAKYGWDAKLSAPNVKDMSYNGVKYGLPLNASAVGAWYNGTHLKKADVTVPTTFAEVEKANAALVKVGIQPWLMGGKYGWGVMRFFEWFLEMTAGPAEHDKLRNVETSWNTSSVVDAFAILQKWAKKNWLPNGVMGLDPSQIEAELAGGKGAMTLDGQWIETTLIQAKMPSYGTFIPPTDRAPLRFSGFTEGLFITAETAHAQNAEKLLNFFTKVSTQQLDQNSYSTVKGVPAPAGFKGAAQWTKWIASHDHYVIQDQSLSTSLANAYFSIQSNVVQGSQTPAAAAAAMQKAVEASKSGS
jgi:ABC-type glycerol-3-phosphate transport system substrate-binding protein